MFKLKVDSDQPQAQVYNTLCEYIQMHCRLGVGFGGMVRDLILGQVPTDIDWAFKTYPDLVNDKYRLLKALNPNFCMDCFQITDYHSLKDLATEIELEILEHEMGFSGLKAYLKAKKEIQMKRYDRQISFEESQLLLNRLRNKYPQFEGSARDFQAYEDEVEAYRSVDQGQYFKSGLKAIQYKHPKVFALDRAREKIPDLDLKVRQKYIEQVLQRNDNKESLVGFRVVVYGPKSELGPYPRLKAYSPRYDSERVSDAAYLEQLRTQWQLRRPFPPQRRFVTNFPRDCDPEFFQRCLEKRKPPKEIYPDEKCDYSQVSKYIKSKTREAWELYCQNEPKMVDDGDENYLEHQQQFDQEYRQATEKYQQEFKDWLAQEPVKQDSYPGRMNDQEYYEHSKQEFERRQQEFLQTPLGQAYGPEGFHFDLVLLPTLPTESGSLVQDKSVALRTFMDFYCNSLYCSNGKLECLLDADPAEIVEQIQQKRAVAVTPQSHRIEKMKQKGFTIEI